MKLDYPTKSKHILPADSDKFNKKHDNRRAFWVFKKKIEQIDTINNFQTMGESKNYTTGVNKDT